MNIPELKGKPLPLAVIAGVMALVSVVTLFTAGYFGPGVRAVDPRVTTEFEGGAIRKQTPAAPTAIPTTMDGEVARTAERLGEATALAFAASLHGAAEQLRGHPPHTVRDLLAGIAARNLMPPVITPTQDEDVLASPHGTLFVRYRPMPLGIEVIAIGRDPEDGPALLVRIPDEVSEKGEAKLYIAGTLGNVQVPAPFAPAAEVIALGWSPEIWGSLK